MAKRWPQKLTAILLFVVAAALIVTGTLGMSRRASLQGQALLNGMRVRSLLTATGSGVVESYANIAKKEANAKATEQGVKIAERRKLVDQAVEEARAKHSSIDVDLSQVDTAPLTAAAGRLEAALSAYYAQEKAEQQAYVARMGERIVDQPAEEQPNSADALNAEGGEADMSLGSPAEQKVDLSGFVASEQLGALMAEADRQFVELAQALKAVYPVLDDEAMNSLRDTIKTLIAQPGDDYATAFDRFNQAGGAEALTDNLWTARMLRYGDDMISVGVGLCLLGLLILFYRALRDKLGVPRIIIGSFFTLLCVLSALYDLSLMDLLSNSVVRMGMNAILVLAMLPGIQCGISLNLGLPIGIVGGLLGGLLCIEFKMTGALGFWFAIAVGMAIAAVTGYLYGLLLNRLKGNEMAVTTYVGFSVVSLMSIAWLTLPFKSLELRWPLGTGLRNTLSLGSSFKHVLDNHWAFNIGSFRVPTGLLLFMAAACALMWLLGRSRIGVAMQAVGNNPRFAEATGISVDRMRIVGTMLSTMLGAVGILVYSQSYGFMQLYNAPRQMGFIAASAILIGGATTARAKISHVIIGTFLFQGVLTLGMPVANALVPQSTISETLRILISNGIILYALTKSGGASRG